MPDQIPLLKIVYLFSFLYCRGSKNRDIEGVAVLFRMWKAGAFLLAPTKRDAWLNKGEGYTL